MSIVKNLSQLVFPARCVACSIFYKDLANDFNICDKCLKAFTNKEQVSKRGLLNIYAGAEYNNLTSNLILAAKEGNQRSARKFLASLIFSSLKRALIENCVSDKLIGTKIYLIPIPSRASADRSRGYAHIDLLLIELRRVLTVEKKELDFSVLDLLQHTRKIKDQSSLNFHEREANMLNAFKVKKRQDSPNFDSEALIFLIDDLVASGSTILAADFALNQRGFRTTGVLTACASSRFTY